MRSPQAAKKIADILPPLVVGILMLAGLGGLLPDFPRPVLPGAGADA